MDNMNNHTHHNIGAEKEFSDAITTLTLPDKMANELLESCIHAKHSQNILFRHSKLIAAVLLVALSTTICTTAYAAYGLYQTKNLAVFFEYNTSQETLDTIGKKIKAIPGVFSIRFVSSDEAWTNFQETYLTDELSAMFDENPLKNSYNYYVTVKLDADTTEIREQIEQIDGVRLVNDLNELKKME